MVAFLRELSIPEPVTGGLLFSIFFGIVYAATGVAVEFNSPGPVCYSGGHEHIRRLPRQILAEERC
jgi:Na+/glutamate symporter